MSEAKCPVTFFKDKCIDDNLDLNYMMVAPYHSNLAANITRSMAFDEVKESIINANKTTAYQICNITNNTAIYSYVKMNVSDLFTRLYTKVSSSFLGRRQWIPFDIDKVENLTTDFNLPVDDDTLNNTAALYPIVDVQMEAIFQKSVVLLNSYAIVSIQTMMSFKHNSFIGDFYEKLYRECYGIEEGVDLGDASFENTSKEDVYTFLTAIYRETISNELYQYRAGLGLIGVNAISMLLDTPGCFKYNNINNLEYNTLNMLKENPMLNFMEGELSETKPKQLESPIS